MSCDYRYDIQPAQRVLSCSQLTAFALQCKVVSNENDDFSITWHYSNSEPDSSNIHVVPDIHNSRSLLISILENDLRSNANISLTSELRVNEINEKVTIDGYYWCSVNSNNNMTSNPSVVLHIWNRIDCTTKVESWCGDTVNFYSISQEWPPRCADQNVSVDIVEAQNCTIGDRIEPDTKQITGLDLDPEITDGIDVQNVSITSTPTSMTKTLTLPLTLGITIGASMGGLILILFITIGLLLTCMVRMKANMHQKGVTQLNSTTPFDDIHMHSSALVTDKSETDEEASRAAKMSLELNISYECPQDIITTPQANENVYACIQ